MENAPDKQNETDLSIIADLIDADLDEVSAGHYSAHHSHPNASVVSD